MSGIISSYIAEKGFISHHTVSFNDFINYRIETIIAEENSIQCEVSKDNVCECTFSNVSITPPMTVTEGRKLRPTTPEECRERDMSYEGTVCVDIMIKKGDGTLATPLGVQTMYKYPLCKIPMIVPPNNDDECGGYFIINGKERVIIPQERGAYNIPITHFKNGNYFIDMRSISHSSGHSVYIALTHVDDNILVTIPNIEKKVPLGVLFKAMDKPLPAATFIGVTIDYNSTTIESARQDMASRCDVDDIGAYLSQLISNELFPHMGNLPFENKLQLLYNLHDKLYRTVLKKRDLDDRDALSFKRVESIGVLFADIFRASYKNFIRKGKIEMKMNVVNFIAKYNSIITRDLKKSIMTGHWGCRKNAYIRLGVSQILSRLNWTSTIAQLRRCMIPISKEGKCTDIRQLHPSHAFFFCACETPEGQTVGIVKNLALTCELTTIIDQYPIIDIVRSLVSSDTLSEEAKTGVFINGQYIATSTPSLVNTLKEYRLKKIIHPHVSISWNEYDDEIHLFTDEGRCIRPLINLEKIHCLDPQSFSNSVSNGSIIYLDSLEIEKEVVAMTLDDCSKYSNHTLLEIHPNLMMGVIGACIPFSANNQAPRNVYYASMCKQAIGIPPLGYYTDALHRLMFAQKPLSLTNVSRNFNPHEVANGINCIVAIMCFSGFNVEDSIIVNKAAIDRGLFHSIKYKSITISGEGLGLPVNPTRSQVSHLQLNGLPKIGSVLNVGDILASRISGSNILVGTGDEGVVDSILETTNEEYYKLVKIRIKTIKIPELGDKICSRSAQKSTIGLILPPEDMPTCTNGTIPDLILNPHSMPSRMTISQLLCCIVGKKTLYDGVYRDCTAMDPSTTQFVQKLCQELETHGINGYGTETLFNGQTGEMFKAKIFIGPTYYHKLKHIVSDKMYARGRGGMHEMTRQPKGGRSQNGALRIGELETNAINGLGLTSVFYDRMLLQSDKYSMVLCNSCGYPPKMPDFCPDCNVSNLNVVNIPFSCKLLFQLVQSLGIKMIQKV
jgi:DNA-directed RNA polymerase II subunit RPB2